MALVISLSSKGLKRMLTSRRVALESSRISSDSGVEI
jgi:hypothetical protein